MEKSREYIAADDYVGSYMRQLGKLERLTTEEEIFYIKQYEAGRACFRNCLTKTPGFLYQELNAERHQDHSGRRHSHFSLEKESEVDVDYFKEALLQAQDAIELNSVDVELRLNELKEMLSSFRFTTTFYNHIFQKFYDSFSSDFSFLTKDDWLSHKGEMKEAYFTMQEAANKIVEGNLRLVVSVSRKFSKNYDQFLDFIQEGNIGLLAAIEKFDYRKGYTFSTYATWWIRQAVNRTRTELSRTVRLPANMISQIGQVNKAEQALLQDLGRTPTVDEIAVKTELSSAKVRALQKMTQQSISLQATVQDDEKNQLGQFIEDEKAEAPDKVAEKSFVSETLAKVLETLNDREVEILKMRFGLKDGHCYTLEEIGAVFEISRERIRQIEAAAIKKLRHPDTRELFTGK